MKLEDLSKSFDFAFDHLARWYSCLRNPARTCTQILSLSADGTDSVRRALSVWITAFLLTVLTTGWVYQLYGIGFGNMSFHLSQSIVLLAMLFATVISIQAGLRLRKIEIPFGTLFVTWTVYVSAFSPIYSLLVSPSLAIQVSALKEIKAAKHSLESGVKALVVLTPEQMNSSLYVFGAVLGVVLLPFSLVQLGRIMEAVSRVCGTPRARVIEAASLGLLISVLPLFLLGILYQTLIFSFL